MAYDTNNPTTNSYRNTMIFTIISAITSVVLLIVFLVIASNEYLPFIIAFESGLILIIIYTIYKIIKADSTSIISDAGLVVQFDHCPDYWTKKYDSTGRVYCSNEWVNSSLYGDKTTLKMYPFNPNPSGNQYPLPHTLDSSPPVDGSLAKYDKFYLDSFTTSSDSTNQKCKYVLHEPNDKTDTNSGYSVLPWTTIRSKCKSFAD